MTEEETVKLVKKCQAELDSLQSVLTPIIEMIHKKRSQIITLRTGYLMEHGEQLKEEERWIIQLV